MTGCGAGFVRGATDVPCPGWRQVGQVGDGCLLDLPAFPPVPAEQDGIASPLVPDGFDLVGHGIFRALGTEYRGEWRYRQWNIPVSWNV